MHYIGGTEISLLSFVFQHDQFLDIVNLAGHKVEQMQKNNSWLTALLDSNHTSVTRRQELENWLWIQTNNIFMERKTNVQMFFNTREKRRFSSEELNLLFDGDELMPHYFILTLLVIVQEFGIWKLCQIFPPKHNDCTLSEEQEKDEYIMFVGWAIHSLIKVSFHSRLKMQKSLYYVVLQ